MRPLVHFTISYKVHLYCGTAQPSVNSNRGQLVGPCQLFASRPVFSNLHQIASDRSGTLTKAVKSHLVHRQRDGSAATYGR